MLSSLAMQEDGILQRDLAALCCVEPATMTVLLRKMQQDGLIEKRSTLVSGGKRAYNIYLTDKGHKLAKAVNLIMENAEKLAFTNFSASERDTFLTLLNRLTENLTEK